MTDYTGMRIGQLTVLELVTKTPYSKRAWKCICGCGNIITRKDSSLHNSIRDKRNANCGCITKQNLTSGDVERCSKAGLHRKDAFKDGCNIQMTFRDGTIKGNTSGTQGVSYSKINNKWHCYIGYKQYRANLGYYEDIEDAIKIRTLAEQAIKDNTFEDFFFRIRGHHLGEKQQKYVKKR